jgi:putative endonuclease
VGDPRHQLGIAAEAVVADHLEAQGWQILARRWRCSFGEIDLACLNARGVLVGVEVRARRSSRAGSPVESVDRRRLQRLRSTLVEFAARHAVLPRDLRVDLAAVEFVDGEWRVTMHAAVDAW